MWPDVTFVDNKRSSSVKKIETKADKEAKGNNKEREEMKQPPTSLWTKHRTSENLFKNEINAVHAGYYVSLYSP
jgi:hypothetical protein